MRERYICTIFAAVILFFAFSSEAMAEAETEAAEVRLEITSSIGKATANILDDKYETQMFQDGGSITITSDEDIYSLYVEWETPPEKYNIKCGPKNIEGGQNGFLHEFIELPDTSKEVVMEFAGDVKICDIKGFGEGTLPEDIQNWKPQCKRADLLVFSSHADDEVLFLGAPIVKYASKPEMCVQLVYFSSYAGTASSIREHEKLDGLWHMGVRNYPEMGAFPDVYAKNLADAEAKFGLEKTVEYMVEMIRKYKPYVVISQDVEGEYGHGTHMLLAKALQLAVEVSNDTTAFQESAVKYGVYDVPKTYLHLYPENKLYIDCAEIPNEDRGKSILEICKEAYKKHVSQQWCWFFVSDSGENSIADFGLYRSTVGEDSTESGDMMENVVRQSELPKIPKFSEIMSDVREKIKHRGSKADIEVTPIQVPSTQKYVKLQTIAYTVLWVAVVAAVILFLRTKGKK